MAKHKEPVSVRVPDDILEEIERIEEEQGISRTEAVNRLLRQGIEHKDAENNRLSFSTALLNAGLIGILIGTIGLIGSVSVSVGPAAVVIGSLTVVFAIFIRRTQDL